MKRRTLYELLGAIASSRLTRRLFWHYFIRIFFFYFKLFFELEKKAENMWNRKRKIFLINFSFMPVFFLTHPTNQPTQRWEFIIKNNLFVDFLLLHFPHRLLFFFYSFLYSHVHTCRFKFIFHNSTRTEEKYETERKKTFLLRRKRERKIH